MSPGNPSFGTWIASTRRALVALACLAPLVGLVLPLQAEAQTTFVSNTGQSSATNLRAVGPVGAFFIAMRSGSVRAPNELSPNH